MTDKKQPTILVKKSDGTTVRMTLDEIKAMKNMRITNDTNVRKHKPHPAQPGKPHKTPPPPQALATTAPVPEIFVDEAKSGLQRSDSRLQPVSRTQITDVSPIAKKAWQKADASSPLEEAPTEKPPVPTAPTAGALLEDTPIGPAKEVVEKALRKAGWDVGEAVQQRLSPLILSRVKDVRTDAQFLVHAMTPTHRGGVGLSPTQAEQLLSAILSFLPQQRGSRTPAAGLPVGAGSSAMGQGSGVAKPVMRDVISPPAPMKQMGPKEEFAVFSLADFKRLGATTEASLSRLKEKFDTLKSESYLAFLEVRDAWFQSPLYAGYIAALHQALKEKKKLSEVLAPAGAKGELTPDIVKAIVEVNKYISV